MMHGVRYRRPRWPAVAAEEPGAWQTAPDGGRPGAGPSGGRDRGGRGVVGGDRGPQRVDGPQGGGPQGVGGDGSLGVLEDALTAVVTRSVDELPDPALREELAAVNRMRNRLDARMSALMSALSRRDAARAREQRPDNPRAGEQAARQTRNDLVDELKLTHGEVKQAQKIGFRLAQAPTAREAFAEGALSRQHAVALADALQHVADPQLVADLEVELTAAAKQMNPVEFGKHVRGRLAELDEAAAVEAGEARMARRTGRLNLAPDGYQELYVRAPGLAGEKLATAVHAFRRPDAPGESRTPAQATADAVVAMAEAALASAAAPTQHGVRPHVIVTVSEDSATSGTGVAQTIWSGPLPVAEVEEVFDDSSVSRLVRDARGLPVEASEAVRSVPAAVWRGVMGRDRCCIADGCDQPAQWCQVMHLATPYRFQGRLTIQTAGLGCGYHHKKLDNHGWQITWIDGRPILHHPDKPPRRPASRGDPP